MASRRFEGKNVIVTGAGQGIGLAIAERFADEGADVMLIGRRREPLQALVAQIEAGGGKAWLHPADVSDSAAVDAAVAAAHERWGRIDVLVNNAGIAEEKDFLEIEDAGWDAIIATNLRGAFLMSQRVARLQVAAGGARSSTSPRSTRPAGTAPTRATTPPRRACSASTGRWRSSSARTAFASTASARASPTPR